MNLLITDWGGNKQHVFDGVVRELSVFSYQLGRELLLARIESDDDQGDSSRAGDDTGDDHEDEPEDGFAAGGVGRVL